MANRSDEFNEGLRLEEEARAKDPKWIARMKERERIITEKAQAFFKARDEREKLEEQEKEKQK